METQTDLFAIIAGFLTAIVMMVILVYGLYRFYKFLLLNKTLFGDTLKARIVSLGITSLMFPAGIEMIFVYPIKLVSRTLISFYSSIDTLVASNGNTGFTDSISYLFSTTSRDLNTWFQAYSVVSVILALASWSLIGKLIDSFQKTGETSESKSESDIIRQNIILGLVFALSIYLSLAAIITVPYFTENKDQELKEEPLKDYLDRIKIGYENNTFKSFSTEKPILEIDSAVLQAIDKIQNQQSKSYAKQVYDSWSENYSSNMRIRKATEDALIQENEIFKTKLVAEETNIISTYNTESVNLKSKLKLSFKSSLSEYYRYFAESYTNRTNMIKRIVQSGDDEMKRDLLTFRRDFTEYVTKASKPDSTNVELVGGLYIYKNERNYYSGLDNYTTDNYPMQIPSVPTPGDDLGIFKGIAQWLIKPSSMALVLIVGMLGFGLFGAVISTFVRETSNTEEYNKDAVIIKDIPGVIIRGISAAIVIFLGVKGGLAIFSSGEGEPNPYALFFTCLVGAVYSEKIWEWAKEKLSSSLKTPIKPIKNEGENSVVKNPEVLPSTKAASGSMQSNEEIEPSSPETNI